MHMHRRAWFIAALAACSTAMVASAPAAAAPGAAWPADNKPIRLIVPAPPGGTIDVLARLVGEQIASDLKVPLIVENKPGAGGAIGAQALLSAPADGQALMVVASNVLNEIPHVMKTNFDTLKDVKPIISFARSPMVLVGPADGPPDFAGLVAALRSSGKSAYASYSAGTASHYAGALLAERAKLDLQHVPFPGSPPALTQVMGGQIPLMFDGLVTSLPQIKAGKLRCYAIAWNQRLPQLPGVPTMAELGHPEISFANWIGIVGAVALPDELVERIAATLQRSAQAPRLREKLKAVGFEPDAPIGPAELAKSVRADFERYGAIVRAHGIKAGP